MMAWTMIMIAALAGNHCDGDFNYDDYVNQDDAGILMSNFGACGGEHCPWDLNDDGKIDTFDYWKLWEDYSGPCPLPSTPDNDNYISGVDVNQDGVLDYVDLLSVLQHMGCLLKDPVCRPHDLDGKGSVDEWDLIIIMFRLVYENEGNSKDG